MRCPATHKAQQILLRGCNPGTPGSAVKEDDFFLPFSGQNPRLSAPGFTLHAVMVNYLCILISECDGCNLKVTSTSKACNGFSTLFHFLDGACAFNLMDLSMGEEF